MKTFIKFSLPEILTNPISRDLLIIFIIGALAAITLVSGCIIILNQL